LNLVVKYNKDRSAESRAVFLFYDRENFQLLMVGALPIRLLSSRDFKIRSATSAREMDELLVLMFSPN